VQTQAYAATPIQKGGQIIVKYKNDTISKFIKAYAKIRLVYLIL